MEPADKIITCAGDLFLKTTIRSVTMDDLARCLGISKKTIYRYFRNKTELVIEFIKKHIKHFKEQINIILGRSDNIPSQIAGMLTYLPEVFSRINPFIIHEIKTYYPEAWHIFQEFKTVFLVGALKQLLTKGKIQGCIRQNLDEQIIAWSQINLIEASFNDKLFPVALFNTKVVQCQLLEYFCFGIAIPK